MSYEKISILMEALPYIKKFKGKTFVIKYGGSIMQNEKSKKAFIEDIVLMKFVGINIVIVHGGGPDISKFLKKLDIDSNFIKGLRVTDKDAVEVVEMILSSKINKEITSKLCSHDISSVGISGRDGNLIEAKKKYIFENGKKLDIGYVGDVKNINKKLLIDLLEKDHLPVVSPIGSDLEGNTYNVNADYVASHISACLKAEKLILLTDVKGIYKDLNDESSFISSISIDKIREYIKLGIIKGGMIPKMECCINAIEGGTKNIHLLDGRKEHSLLLEIFTNNGIGTMIKGGIKNAS